MTSCLNVINKSYKFPIVSKVSGKTNKRSRKTEIFMQNQFITLKKTTEYILRNFH